MMKAGSSYLSQSELPLTFGLGRHAAVQSIEITWPNGKVERLGSEKAGQILTIEEGRGIISKAAFR
jgi:hypothetical protein